MNRHVLRITAIFAVALLFSAPAVAKDPILIGVNLELSGRIAVTGNDTLRGIKAAYSQQKTLLDRPVKLSICDNASTVQGSVACANRFVDEGVAAVLGSYASSNSIPAAEVLQDAGVVMVSTGSTNPATTKIGSYIFRTSYTDQFQGGVAAEYAYKEIGAHRVAIFRQQDDDYSVGLTGFFKNVFEGLGGQTIVLDFVRNTVDFTAQINNLRTFHPDMIYFTGFCAEGASLIPQLRHQGFKQPIMGGDASDDDQCPDGGGKTFDGFMFTSFGGPGILSGKTKKRAEAFGKHFHSMFPDASYNGFVLTGADAYRVVAKAIKEAGNADSSAVQKKLAQMKDFPGVSGSITYAVTDGTPANRVMGLFEYQFGDGDTWKKVPLRGISMATWQ